MAVADKAAAALFSYSQPILPLWRLGASPRLSLSGESAAGLDLVATHVAESTSSSRPEDRAEKLGILSLSGYLGYHSS